MAQQSAKELSLQELARRTALKSRSRARMEQKRIEEVRAGATTKRSNQIKKSYSQRPKKNTTRRRQLSRNDAEVPEQDLAEEIKGTRGEGFREVGGRKQVPIEPSYPVPESYLKRLSDLKRRIFSERKK